MVMFNTILSLAYGPPALLGLVIKKTPHWSGMVSLIAGLVIGIVGTFGFGWGLVMNLIVVTPVSVGLFLASAWFDRPGTAQAKSRDLLFLRLATPIDVRRELAGSVDQTTQVFRFLSRATAAVGLLSLLLLFSVAKADRGVVIAYAGITLVVAFGLTFIRGKNPLELSDLKEEPDQLAVPAGIGSARKK
jgi:hypothetical protein